MIRNALLLLGVCTMVGGAPPAAPVRGTLLIVGGGSQPAELVDRFVMLAGGAGKAKIAVVPMASEEAQATGDEKAEQLRGLGAEVVVFNVNRFEAESASTAKRLDGVTGIWFSGGDQIRLTRILLGTPVLAAMHARYAAGAVLGGTSAGAAIMTDSMLTGNQRQPGDTLGYYGDEFPDVARGVIEVVPGLGFLHGAIVDQHFLRRERHNRLFAVILERPALVGVGIDEGTALEVDPDGQWRVWGRSAVTVYDARKSRVTSAGAPRLGATGVQLQLLPAGSRFDPRSGKASLPPS
jgi:cyanophycinase